MAKKKAQEQSAEPQAEVAATPVASDTPADTHGIVVTSPPETSSNLFNEPPEWDITDPEDDSEEYETEPLTVSQEVSKDPSATVSAALVAIGKIYNEVEQVLIALTKHIRESNGQPELQGFLQRIQTTLADFRHAVNSVESSSSQHLRDAIIDSVA